VKVSVATNGAATIPVKPRTGLDLFGDLDDGPAPDVGGHGDDDVDLDDDMADIDEGWIVDDMDGALHKEPEGRRWDGNVKEMGENSTIFPSSTCEANKKNPPSEYYQGSATLPAGIDAVGK